MHKHLTTPTTATTTSKQQGGWVVDETHGQQTCGCNVQAAHHNTVCLLQAWCVWWLLLLFKPHTPHNGSRHCTQSKQGTANNGHATTTCGATQCIGTSCTPHTPKQWPATTNNLATPQTPGAVPFHALCVCVLWTPHKPMATTTTGHAHHQPCLTTTTNNKNTFMATSCGGDEGVLRVVWQNTTPHMQHTPHERGVQVQHTQTTMLLAGFTQQTNNAIHKWSLGAMQCSAAMVVVV